MHRTVRVWPRPPGYAGQSAVGPVLPEDGWRHRRAWRRRNVPQYRGCTPTPTIQIQEAELFHGRVRHDMLHEGYGTIAGNPTRQAAAVSPSGGLRVSSIFPSQLDPGRGPRTPRHVAHRPQEPGHLRPLPHRQRAGTARGRCPVGPLPGPAGGTARDDGAWDPSGPARDPRPPARAVGHRPAVPGLNGSRTRRAVTDELPTLRIERGKQRGRPMPAPGRLHPLARAGLAFELA